MINLKGILFVKIISVLPILSLTPLGNSDSFLLVYSWKKKKQSQENNNKEAKIFELELSEAIKLHPEGRYFIKLKSNLLLNSGSFKPE